MKAAKQEDETIRKMSEFLTNIDKGMAEMATVSDMIIEKGKQRTEDTGMPKMEFDPQEGISIIIPGNMMGFIKTPERYWQVVAYCMTRYFVLNALWHDEEQLDLACESFLRQTAEHMKPRGIIARACHRLTHRRNLALHYLQMFREGRKIYKEYQSLL